MLEQRAIILSGGLGLRLRPLTSRIPKALIRFRGKPIVDHQLDWLKANGIRKVTFACGYLWEKLRDHVARRRDLDFDFSVEEEPLGTGGALKRAMDLHPDEKAVLVLNGDVLTDLNLKEFVAFFERHEPGLDGAIVLVPFRSPYGVVELEGDLIVRFAEKPTLPHWINGGIYLLKGEVREELPEKGDLETETFPKLKLAGFRYRGYWKAIDTLKDLSEG